MKLNDSGTMDLHNTIKTLLIVLFCIFICNLFVVVFAPGIIEVAYADELPQTIELKIKLNGVYFWVSDEETLSSSPVYLTEGDAFDLNLFRVYIGNEVAYVPGKYVHSFYKENSTVLCDFVQNGILRNNENSLYVMEPNYQNESYTFSFIVNVPNATLHNSVFRNMGDSSDFPIVEETGYTFDGWMLNGVSFTSNTIPDMSPNEAHETQTFNFYANMEANTYTITFHLDDAITTD